MHSQNTMEPVRLARRQLQDAELETKARIVATISGGTAALMLLFLVLALVYSPTLESILIIGGLLLVSLVALGLNHYGHVLPAAWGFLIGYSALIIFSMLANPDVASPTPYFLGVAVVLSGGLIRPAAPFALAAIGTLATGVMVSLTSLPESTGGIPSWLGPIIVPAALLFLLAVVSWVYGAETARMMENLRGITRETRAGIHILGASASEILAATTQITARSAETAAAISETTTTADEVRQTAQLATEKARHVSESSQKTAEVGKSGKQLMEDTVLVMHQIQEQMGALAESIVSLSEQNRAIGEIIATVTDLAERSNLLAVNAAIEAAKAGEQGRGFAVVAQEVRSLAEQSKQATAQVRAILGDIQKATSAAVMAAEQGDRAVEAGVKQSVEAGEAIRRLVEVIAESAQAATQIAASSQQQLVGMDQVAQAMESINQAGTQNAASTKQAGVIAQDLHDLGQRLQALVEKLNV